MCTGDPSDGMGADALRGPLPGGDIGRCGKRVAVLQGTVQRGVSTRRSIPTPSSLSAGIGAGRGGDLSSRGRTATTAESTVEGFVSGSGGLRIARAGLGNLRTSRGRYDAAGEVEVVCAPAERAALTGDSTIARWQGGDGEAVVVPLQVVGTGTAWEGDIAVE